MELRFFGVLHVDGCIATLERDPVQEKVDLAGVGRRGVHDDLVVAGRAREVVVAGALDGDDSGRLLEASVVVGDGDIGTAERESRLGTVEVHVVVFLVVVGAATRLGLDCRRGLCGRTCGAGRTARICIAVAAGTCADCSATGRECFSAG